MSNIPLVEKECLYFLINCDLGNSTIRKLKSTFGSYSAIYNANPEHIKARISPKGFDIFMSQKLRRNLQADFEQLIQHNIQFIMYEDDAYPQKLKDIPDSPCALLVNGHLPSPNIPTVAIIGARGCTNYGSSMANEYAACIANAKIQTISGMASGIDGIAGSAALKAGGQSFAVLGCGPDVCYPPGNRQLFNNLISSGGIISEYGLGTRGAKWHFPVRNRIISGLCDALLVMEAREKSGTLITVDAALEQGRDVYALPGRTCDALSLGCNNLIHQGASMLSTPQQFIKDFLESISTCRQYSDFLSTASISSLSLDNKKIVFTSLEEKTIYEILDYIPLTLDEIAFRVSSSLDLPLPILMQQLTNMCIRGIIESAGGTSYQKK